MERGDTFKIERDVKICKKQAERILFGINCYQLKAGQERTEE